jgi:hypothetical protein
LIAKDREGAFMEIFLSRAKRSEIVNTKPLAQVTMEFTFGMAAAVLLLVGMIRVFAWTGKELISRQNAHITSISTPTCDNTSCPLTQLEYGVFFAPIDIGAAVNSNIFGDQYP